MATPLFLKRLKSQLAQWRLNIAKTYLDREPNTETLPILSPNTLKSMIFLRQDGKIGDYIVSSFVFREIKKANPNIHIGVICSSKNQAILAENPYIDSLHLVQAKSLMSYYQVGKSLKGQYDVAIEPTLVFRPRDLVLLRALNCPYNIGLDKANWRIFNLNIADKSQHFSDIYRMALEKCGFTNIDTTYDIPMQAASAHAVKTFIEQNQLHNYTTTQLHNYIAINFFGASNTRRFSIPQIREILQQLTLAFPEQQFVLLTYPEVTPILQTMCQEFKQCLVYTDTQTIQDSIELIRHADTVISPDTAIIHIATGLNKKIIGLYQIYPQNLANWHPNSPNATVLFFRQHINEITAQQIIQALKS